MFYYVLRKFLSSETKKSIYRSFIRSNFNNCPLVWHFCWKPSSAKMKRLPYRATRLVFTYFDCSYEALIERVNIPTPHISRKRLIVIATFKILHKMPPVYLMVGYESHDRAAPGGAAAPKIAAPEIYFSLLEAQRGIIPNFFRYINCK